MNLNDLARILAQMYTTAQVGYKSNMTHLFGILFAQEIRNANTNALEIINFANANYNANLSEKYVTEINKGKRLADLLRIDNNKRFEILERLNIFL